MAEFSLVFALDKVESVRYRTGDEELSWLAAELQSAHFPMEFPLGSSAKIVRRVRVTCDLAWGCEIVAAEPGPLRRLLIRKVFQAAAPDPPSFEIRKTRA